MSLSTTRELCAVAGAQDVVHGHIELFGMLLYVYSEGVETITRSVSYVKFRAPWDWDTPYVFFPLSPLFPLSGAVLGVKVKNPAKIGKFHFELVHNALWGWVGI